MSAGQGALWVIVPVLGGEGCGSQGAAQSRLDRVRAWCPRPGRGQDRVWLLSCSWATVLCARPQMVC